VSAFLGIDLTSSARRPTAWAALDGRGHLRDLGYATTDADILEVAHRLRPSLVAVDSPIGLPLGLCCLEEGCPCRPALPAKGRLAERLLAARGIPSYFTTKRSIIKAMVYRAMALRRQMEGMGLTVLEVYPYGAKVCLFGRPIPPKTSPQGLAFLRQHLASLVPGVVPHLPRVGHDLADALLAAHTAYLHSRGQTDVLGVEEEGCIVLPRGDGRWS